MAQIATTVRTTERKKIAIVCTGGTISRFYHEKTGELAYDTNIIPNMMAVLRLPHDITMIELMHMDSVRMNDEQRHVIAAKVSELHDTHDAIVITHGTDTMADTARFLHNALSPAIPIVLTGAMRPYVISGSDALQNLTEAFTVASIALPAVYVALHGRVFIAPNVRKNFHTMTFESIYTESDIN